MKEYRIKFLIMREYLVDVEAESMDAADVIADTMEPQVIEQRGAGSVNEDIEILEIAERP